MDVPKIQAASRTPLTHLRFDPSEARRCCLDFCIFDLTNKTPAAFQESTLPVISPGFSWLGREELCSSPARTRAGSCSLSGRSSQNYLSCLLSIITLTTAVPEALSKMSAVQTEHQTVPAPRDGSLQARQSRRTGRAGTRNTAWLWELWVVGGEREKDEASSQQAFQAK